MYKVSSIRDEKDFQVPAFPAQISFLVDLACTVPWKPDPDTADFLPFEVTSIHASRLFWDKKYSKYEKYLEKSFNSHKKWKLQTTMSSI